MVHEKLLLVISTLKIWKCFGGQSEHEWPLVQGPILSEVQKWMWLCRQLQDLEAWSTYMV